MTTQGIGQMFALFAAMYRERFQLPGDPDELRFMLGVWADALPVTDEVGVAAARTYCAREGRSPTVAALRDLIGLNERQMTSTEAWELVWKAACIGGSTERGPEGSWPGEVLRAVDVVGWTNITQSADPQWEQKRFEAAYKDFTARTEHEVTRARLLGKVPDGLLPEMKTIEGQEEA